MASPDPFAALDSRDPFAALDEAGSSDPFSALDALDSGGSDRGLLSTIFHETVRDVEGGFNTAVATGGEVLRLLGLSVPIGFEDLTQRDTTGALMLAALGAGGVVGGATRGLGIAGRLGGGALGRAGGTAATEAAAGAAFGLIRPLEDDEGRAQAVLEDAAIFGTLGAGASFAKTAVKATFEGTVGGIKSQLARANLAKGAQAFEAETLAREVGGIRLMNPETGATVSVRRKTPDEVEMIFRHADNQGTTTRTAGSFNDALSKSVGEGFTERLGPARERLTDEASNFIDSGVLRKIEESEGRIFDALEDLRLGEYQAVREFARLSKESKRSFDSLAAEIVTPGEGLVPVKLSNSERRLLQQELPISARQARSMTDADLLREGVKGGLVSAETLEAGVNQKLLIRELTLNDLVPESFADVRVVSRAQDSFMTSVMTPRFIAKLNPIVEPLYLSANRRLHAIEERLGNRIGQLTDLRDSVSPAAARRAVDIIDASARAGSVETARLRAKADARRTGSEEIVRFVDEVTDLFAEYQQELSAIGKLENGLAGYFPIFNAGNWRLELRSLKGGADVGDFKGFHETRRAALEEAARISKINPEAQFSITPKSYWYEENAIAGMDPKQFKAMQRAIERASGEEITSRQAREIAEEFARVQRGETPRPGSGFLKQRTLGLRDFSEDPFQALETYVNSIERVIGFEAAPESIIAKLRGETGQLARGSFVREADDLVAQLPESRSNLKRWVEQYRDDLLGRPRASERAFQALVDHLGIDKPRALKRSLSSIRKWLGWSKLSGFASAALNLTQIPMNTIPVIGPRWTVRGMEVLASPKRYKRAIETMKRAGLDLGTFVPLTEEGQAVAFGSLSKGKIAKASDVLHRIGLFAFNGTEKVNRLVTAWGSYQRALADGATAKAAARQAEEIVARTQFVYRMSNMPEILRGPVGGTLGQFKTFVINEMEFIASLNKAEAARFGASLWALGGASLLLNMPGSDLIDTASSIAFNEKVSEAIRTRATDSAAERALAFGLPGLFNIDMSDRVGVGTVRDITDGLFGPIVGDSQAVGRFFKDAAVEFAANGSVTDETKQAFLQSVLPTAVRRAIRAQRIVDTGEVRNPYTSKLIYRPTARYDTALREFIGLPTMEMQQERSADAIVARTRERYIKNRTSYAKDAARAARAGESGRMREIVAEARRNGYPIDQQTIRYWSDELQRPASERRRRRTPAALREDMQALFEATGSTDQGLLP